MRDTDKNKQANHSPPINEKILKTVQNGKWPNYGNSMATIQGRKDDGWK